MRPFSESSVVGNAPDSLSVVYPQAWARVSLSKKKLYSHCSVLVAFKKVFDRDVYNHKCFFYNVTETLNTLVLYLYLLISSTQHTLHLNNRTTTEKPTTDTTNVPPPPPQKKTHKKTTHNNAIIIIKLMFYRSLHNFTNTTSMNCLSGQNSPFEKNSPFDKTVHWLKQNQVNGWAARQTLWLIQ